MKRMRVPFPCDFCGQVETRAGRLNYSECCENCRRPRRPATVLVPKRVDRGARRAAA